MKLKLLCYVNVHPLNGKWIDCIYSMGSDATHIPRKGEDVKFNGKKYAVIGLEYDLDGVINVLCEYLGPVS